ncbi:MAG: type 4a pilus biogenesis protein PilO [Planctomycetota bacterium]|nr:type 4a pilus biogenesis protein PilO [Planctomycetota bacterium]
MVNDRRLKWQQTAWGLGLALAVAAGLWARQSLLANDRERLATLHQQAGEMEQAVTRRARLLTQAARVEALTAQLRLAVPPRENVGGLLQELGSEMSDLGLGSQHVTTGVGVDAGPLRRLPLEVDCRGDFRQAFFLLRRIEALDRRTRIDRVLFQVDPQNPEEPIGVSLQLSAYARKPGKDLDQP